MTYLLRTTLFFLITMLVVALPAVGQHDTCVVTYTGETRNRIVGPGARISTECGQSSYPGHGHSPPLGNWGATSNYGHKQGTDQFAGWKREDGKWQWNSCTIRAPYLPPNPDLYNYLNHTAQKSRAGVTQLGSRTITYSMPCQWTFWPPMRSASAHGCLDDTIPSSVTQTNNFASLYELDSRDFDQLVTTLYFPSTSVRFSNCTYSGCSERTSEWVNDSRSTDPSTRVSAELRMKASSKYAFGCGPW